VIDFVFWMLFIKPLYASNRLQSPEPGCLSSSQRTVVVLVAIVLAGLVVAFALYWEVFVSVWCFFAAAASVTVLCHFEWSRRRRLQTAGA